MEQRLDEWTKGLNEDYFNRQFRTPYKSTIAFCDWLESLGVIDKDKESHILDIGTGKGANIYYMWQRFPNSYFLGLDINKNLVEAGNAFFEQEQISNCRLKVGDLYNLELNELKDHFEGIVSFQTLSWLPEYNLALSELLKIKPSWIAFSSLFYEGPVDCRIEVSEYTNATDQQPFKKSFYNIYSLPRMRYFLEQNGYTSFQCIPFIIDIDLPKPKTAHMGTYTQKLDNGNRIQLSGPILMSWYYVFAEKRS